MGDGQIYATRGDKLPVVMILQPLESHSAGAKNGVPVENKIIAIDVGSQFYFRIFRSRYRHPPQHVDDVFLGPGRAEETDGIGFIHFRGFELVYRKRIDCMETFLRIH